VNNLKKLAIFAALLIPACAGDDEETETGTVDTGATETVTTPTTPTTAPTTPTGTTTGTGATQTGA